jgi:hypothetical protein
MLAWSFAVQGCRASLSRRALESLKSVVGARPGSGRLAPRVVGRRKAGQTEQRTPAPPTRWPVCAEWRWRQMTVGKSCGNVGPRLWGRVLRPEPGRKRLEGTCEHRL